MPTLPRAPSPAKPPKLSGTVSIPERAAAARVASFLSPGSRPAAGPVQIVDAEGRRTDLPVALREVVQRAATLLAEGRSVAVLPDEEPLSTQAAADLLNISRQYLVRLIDAGEVPAAKVGSHRRLRAADVIAYKASRDSKRAAALDRLTALSEDAGGYRLRPEQD